MKYPIVYTMAKVGTRAMAQGIRDAGFHCPEVHTLDRKAMLAQVKPAIDAGELPSEQMIETMALRRQLDRKRIRRPFYITAVREPIARNISAFFQNHKLNLRTIDIADSGIDTARRAFDIFMKTYPHDLPLQWFDTNVLPQTSVDVYQTPFDPKQGHVRSGRVLVFRADCPDAVKSTVLTETLGRPITVARKNESTAKRYFGLYEKVKEIASFDEAFVNRMYDSKYARHFWTESERSAFRKNWLA
ncbi:putative capsular polysaccharide synthesis family protein [Bauldia litoralis]|uniref:putative capsular polysaccharide synthesis family protein n=1 Tax=Bauldia litoralis TaxID=665467 RepID=UPI003267981E